MAKKSRNRTQRSQKDTGGCMSGLINMFDLRHGHSSNKLLSDSKHGSGRHFATKYRKNKLDSPNKSKDRQDEVDESGHENLNAAITTIKTLMEDEISRPRPSKKIPIEEIDRIRSELGLDVHLAENHIKTSRSLEAVSDIANDQSSPICLDAQHSNCMSTSEIASPTFDLATLMIKLYDGNHRQEKHLNSTNNDVFHVSDIVVHGEHNHIEETSYKLSEKQVVLHNALVNVADVFLSQKSPNTELSGAVHSQEFIDALEILSTNKELLERLLQDQKFKQIQDDQSAQAGKISHLESGNDPSTSDYIEGTGSSVQLAEPINQKLRNKFNRYSPFRKMNKSKGTMPSMENDGSRAMNTIIVLKPCPSRFTNTPITSHENMKYPNCLSCREDGEKGVSHLSFKEIKRRLRHVVRNTTKEQDVISRDGVFHRETHVAKVSGGLDKQHEFSSRTFYNAEYNFESSASPRGKKPKSSNENMKNQYSFPMAGKDRRPNMTTTAHPLTRKSFYEEAKKHLGQMLNARHNVDSSITEISEPLGKILSLTERSISPQLSPRRDKRTDISPSHQCKEDNSDPLNRLKPDSYETSCRGVKPGDEPKVTGAGPEHIDNQIKQGTCILEDLNHEGSTEIIESANTICKEESDWLDANSKSDASPVRCTETGSPVQSGLGPPDEGSPQTPCLSYSFSYLYELSTANPESILEKPERASPVSVLEPLFLEDVTQTETELDTHDDSPKCSQTIHFEEHDNPAIILSPSDSETDTRTCINDIAGRFEYVRAVLELSGLSCENISNRWKSSDKLLDPFVFDEVWVSYKLSEDPMLLFDCIDEELLEIQERFFSCSPWLSFIKQNVRPFPVGENLIQEVCRGIERHLEWQSPRTLDQIIKKDMDGGTWIDLQTDIESMVIEIQHDLLEELMVEIALEMWF